MRQGSLLYAFECRIFRQKRACMLTTYIKMDVKQLKTLIQDAGFEIYRTKDDTLMLAERVRVHLMDSGINVSTSGRIEFVVRAQRSDHPERSPVDQFAALEDRTGSLAMNRGYDLVSSSEVDVRDNHDSARLLDVWYELRFGRDVEASSIVEELRWVFSIERFVGP